MSDFPHPPPWVRAALNAGLVIPAHPLALTARRSWDERRQRALTRYYHAAGAGGIAIGVHTTQFQLREHGLFQPVLQLTAATVAACDRATNRQTVRISGLCGLTKQAIAEATLAREAGPYHAGLLSLAALADADEGALIEHCRAVAREIPLVGFYLQPAAGGRLLPYAFWRRFAEIENVIAIKIAPFNRYQTIEVMRAIAESGRNDIALYTGNDDNIVLDLLTPYRFQVEGQWVERRIVGGLLGHWAVGTQRAVELHAECRRLARQGEAIPIELLRRANEVTDTNGAYFDVANGFAGCVPGLHEVLRRQGLFDSIACLDPTETLSPGQREEIERVHHAYPHLSDEDFVTRHRAEWLDA